jgi:hypothetical protein
MSDRGGHHGLGDWPTWGPTPPELIDPANPPSPPPPGYPSPPEGPYPTQPSPPQSGPASPAPPTSNKAVLGLVVGVVTVGLLCLVPAINLLGGPAALWLGIVARREILRSQGRQSGDGLAVAAIVIGATLIGIAVVELGVIVTVLVLNR